jgi:hypothetical protein
VTVRHEGGKAPRRSSWSQGGAWYARRTGDQALLKLDPAKAAELVKTFGEL